MPDWVYFEGYCPYCYISQGHWHSRLPNGEVGIVVKLREE